MKIKVQITETLQKIVEVEADTASDAVMQITRDYNDCKIVLDASDFVEFDIREYKEV